MAKSYILAMAGSKVVGWLVYLTPFPKKSWIKQIKTIVVYPRNLRYGRALVKRALDEMRTQNAKKMFLYAVVDTRNRTPEQQKKDEADLHRFYAEKCKLQRVGNTNEFVYIFPDLEP